MSNGENNKLLKVKKSRVDPWPIRFFIVSRFCVRAGFLAQSSEPVKEVVKLSRIAQSN